MRKVFLVYFFFANSLNNYAQTNPSITSWLQNTTIIGRHYVSGNSTPFNDATLIANVQSVKYSTNYVYVSTQGIPAYVVVVE